MGTGKIARCVFPPMKVTCNSPLFRLISVPAMLLTSSAASGLELHTGTSITTDYVWRGTSQTLGDPAVQASFKVSAPAGWHASAWGSNVDFGPAAGANTEFDFVAGWSGALSDDWALDINLTHYRYPSSAVPLNWTELDTTLTWKQNYWLLVGHSNDALATDANGTYVQIGAKLPLGERYRLEGTLAHYALSAFDDGYSHAGLSAVWTLKAPFELRVTAHDTNSSAKQIFPDLAGSRIEAAIQASF